MIERICACYFSPCHNVKTIVENIATTLAQKFGKRVEVYDFTLTESREQNLLFQEGDLVIMGCPVYAGRVPNKILPYIKEIQGRGALGVAITSYGNRSYENALAELFGCMKKNGFQMLAAAAVVSEHSFAKALATGRPDENDVQQLKLFAEQIGEKALAFYEEPERENLLLQNIPGEENPEVYYTPLKRDGSPAKFLKAVPVVELEKCKQCHMCSMVCPMGSIDKENPAQMNGICIKCQACIHICKEQARAFQDEDFLSHREMLLENYTSRKESEFFLK